MSASSTERVSGGSVFAGAGQGQLALGGALLDIAKPDGSKAPTYRTGTVVSWQSATATATITIAGSTTQVSGVPALTSAYCAPGQVVILVDYGPIYLIVACAGDGKWIEVGSGGSAPAFTGGFNNYGGGWETVAFMRLNGVTYLKGLVANGALNTGMFNLPVGYRPPGQALFAALNADIARRLQIRPTDGAILFDTTFSTGSYTSLSGISFPIGN